MAWCTDTWKYVSAGVWDDTRHTWKIDLIKTVNLSVRSFLSQDLQSRACTLTYRTLLAIVPALALLFAIGRGFGLQDVLQTELIRYIPSQRQVLQQAFGFVDSYLSEASGGLFVGVGIVFLLWTLISLLSSVEDCFNGIWQISKGRKFWRKVTDYLAIFILLPVMMICASGMSLFMTTSLKTLLPFDFIDSALPVIFDILSVVLSWLFFACSYMLIPNTKVRFIPAIVSGMVVGSAFQILQWVFISGQMYVAKYNAIYGSFSFLPLMLIWLQLVWLFTLIGALMCFAWQNTSEYDFGSKVRNISCMYRVEVSVTLLSVIARRFTEGALPPTTHTLASEYSVPISLAKPIVGTLVKAGLVNYVQSDHDDVCAHPLQPAHDMRATTVGDVISVLMALGDKDFIPGFDKRFPGATKIEVEMTDALKYSNDTLIANFTNNIN